MIIAQPFSELLLRLNGPSPELESVVTRLCDALDQGHVCLPKDQWGVEEAALQGCSVIGRPGEFKPLILDEDGRLYLHRYWRYEHRLAIALRSRGAAPDLIFDEALAQQGLSRYLADSTADQRAGALNFLRRPLSILTGGPGTGKTRTATVAAVLLAEQFAARGIRPRFVLTAPTGKAAARLASSLGQALARLALPPGLLACLPAGASTLHRLLGGRPGSSQFRHHESNPLPLDALIVDEASMVDLPLMAKLFAALRPETRIMLLGDPHQLASVEAGHVLGDLCASPLRASITELKENHRFTDASGIYQLSRSINEGEVPSVLQLLKAPPKDLISTPLPLPSALVGVIQSRVIEGFQAALHAPSPAEALAAFDSYRILCAVREGPYGVGPLNRLVERVLAEAGLIRPESAHYAGRPILILRNAPLLGLYNGDIGIVRPNEHGELRAWFPGDRGVRDFAPSRLPEHETAYAMTIHKTQGSEFTRVLVIMPEAESPVLTRELLYTAVTRAREAVELWWSEPSLAAALARRVSRWSGLADRLRA